MKKLLIVKVGNTLPELAARRGDFDDWFKAGLGLDPDQLEVFDPRGGAEFPPLATLAGVLVTGSHCMVTEHLDWSERTARWLVEVAGADVPILGVCYGHQLLAYAFGGEVGNNPRGPQEGTTRVELTPAGQKDALLGGLGADFAAQVSHTQSALRLPPGAVRLVFDGWDMNQAFRVGQNTWGVQFHPEIDADIARTYIHAERDELAAEGQDVEQILSTLRESPVAAQVLRRFAELVFDSVL